MPLTLSILNIMKIKQLLLYQGLVVKLVLSLAKFSAGKNKKREKEREERNKINRMIAHVF